MLEHARRRPQEFADLARDLFGAMANGGRVGFEPVAWFNGGLFDDDRVGVTATQRQRSQRDRVDDVDQHAGHGNLSLPGHPGLLTGAERASV